jgi:hypothetical protein
VSENPGQGPRGSHSFDEIARGLASGSLSRRRALKLFAAAFIGALVPSRALAVPGPCPPGSDKTTICHRPVGRPPETLCVSPSAAQSHIDQHNGPPGAGPDTKGACEDSTTTSTTTTAPPGTTTSTTTTAPPGTTTSTTTTAPPGTTTSTTTTARPSPPPPCKRRGERCGGDRPECCGNLVCRGRPGHKHCRRRRRDDEGCKRRGERCGGDRPECCGNLVCRGWPGHKHCRRRRRDDD